MFSLRVTIATGGLVRSVLEIGNTLSRVPNGGRVRQRCAPEGSTITREAVKATSTPQRRTLLTRFCSHGHNEIVVLGVNEANWIGPNHTCRTAELAINGTADARSCAEIFRAHREGGRAARYEDEDTYLSEG